MPLIRAERTLFSTLYRHIDTRQTIHIDQDGKTCLLVNRLESPESDIFERIAKAEAKEHVFGSTPHPRT